jgi:16S rRNA (adenine1518-N6/adenine1519-N6)-dimethyltransferase
MLAKKSLGQHFLRSEKALRAMVEAGDVNKNDTVVEIGPGMGALTEKLLATGCKLLAVEKDDNLYEALKIKFQKEISSGQLHLIRDDILEFEVKRLIRCTRQGLDRRVRSYKLIANIPYNITGAILKKFLGAGCQPKKMVLLVQKEVAERIVVKKSKPFDSASGKESILSISVKAYGMPRYVETVKAGSFAPMPSVDSAIIAIEDISKNFFSSTQANQGFSEDDFFKILKTGFKSKRKKFSSNLSELFDKNQVQEAFKKLALDENIRAENLNIDTWKKLCRSLPFSDPDLLQLFYKFVVVEKSPHHLVG